ncbi:MAG: SDR family NAD(P)-dependent oxidoreductase [Gammaproteobacteria bacterium]|nr:SDR family NAD(P)-dependent oxidoreductase [Gammaproteobacteria bacterium]NIN39551.1 SDR family NAD(P)-dependent oxidoreductase [Gammaproteobacteria bacterium]NIO25108.1 SDR family NAD(P)-dependent oxidoreductase [Gammaproteobacteria bacterium]NIO65737.1 SDR family NAD(P)-dependent oxidoreductase [Gammaproteobacteria bacterium]NIP45826.1 SDR family NAD(P)-dependent oxidoreductase [Gammaproteobacteria bacterium]
MATSAQTVVLVTGATGVIGGAIARELAATPGYEVVVVAREEKRARKAVDAIRSASGSGGVRFVLADVSRRQSIQALADAWQGPLHVLVNDAAVAPRKRETTPEGIELTFATNVLAYLWMSEAFALHLERTAPARIVNVASYWAGELDLDDLEFNRRRFDNHTAYRQSKQANRMLTVALAERLAGRGISVNACHPGDPSSVLSRNLGFGGSQSPEEAARTPVMLARGELGADLTGRYFEHGREANCRFAADREAVERLYAVCGGYG